MLIILLITLLLVHSSRGLVQLPLALFTQSLPLSLTLSTTLELFLRALQFPLFLGLLSICSPALLLAWSGKILILVDRRRLESASLSSTVASSLITPLWPPGARVERAGLLNRLLGQQLAVAGEKLVLEQLRIKVAEILVAGTLLGHAVGLAILGIAVLALEPVLALLRLQRVGALPLWLRLRLGAVLGQVVPALIGAHAGLERHVLNDLGLDLLLHLVLVAVHGVVAVLVQQAQIAILGQLL